MLLTDFVGIDCEMVDVDRGGRRSALARVSLTRYPSKEVDLSKFSKQHYEIVYDVIVKPSQKVTDFRTKDPWLTSWSRALSLRIFAVERGSAS